MSEYLKVPVGDGKYLTIYAVPSGWRYDTGSSLATMYNAGPVGAGSVVGTLVFKVTQGPNTRAQKYRLRYDGFGVSFGVGASTPVSGQGSTEQMPSAARGQVFRLPRSGARMGQAQEAGSPTGLAGQFLLISYDRGFGAGKSSCFMFLGGSNAQAASLDKNTLLQYKYATMFDGVWGGSVSGVGFAVFRGKVYPPSGI